MSNRTPSSTHNEDPNIVWFAQECRRNHVRIDGLVRSAERLRDFELAAFFRRALDVSDRRISV